VDVLLDGAEECGETALGHVAIGCAGGTTAHVNADELADWSVDDYAWTGVAFHEFAHIVQDEADYAKTGVLSAAFAGKGGFDDDDLETSADCFVRAYFDPDFFADRTLRHDGRNWTVHAPGYGYVCSDAEVGIVRDWYGAKPFHFARIAF